MIKDFVCVPFVRRICVFALEEFLVGAQDDSYVDE